jgi:hypothetical protein
MTPQDKAQNMLWIAEFKFITNDQRTFRQNLFFTALIRGCWSFHTKPLHFDGWEKIAYFMSCHIPDLKLLEFFL